MPAADRERSGRRVLDRRWLRRRIEALTYHVLFIFSRLSPAGSFVSLISDSETASAPPDLHTQLEEILDCVWRQERILRLERRIEASWGAKPGKQPRSRRESTPDNG